MRKKNPKPVEINASFNEGTSSNSSDLQTPTETKLPLKEVFYFFNIYINIHFSNLG